MNKFMRIFVIILLLEKREEKFQPNFRSLSDLKWSRNRNARSTSLNDQNKQFRDTEKMEPCALADISLNIHDPFEMSFP